MNENCFSLRINVIFFVTWDYVLCNFSKLKDTMGKRCCDLSLPYRIVLRRSILGDKNLWKLQVSNRLNAKKNENNDIVNNNDILNKKLLNIEIRAN